MKLVVDTNIVFSALITPDGVVGETLLRPWPRLQLAAPEHLRVELAKYREKAAKTARLSADDFLELEGLVLSRISIVPDAVIPAPLWERAFDLVKDIDEDDLQFVALALHLDCPLWTGDKRLVTGLRRRGFKHVLTSDEIRKKLGI